jgi:hypothetical protein
MRDNHHIQNLLHDFEAEPSPAVWTAIEARLPSPGSDKRKFGILLFTSLLAGLLVTLFVNKVRLDSSDLNSLKANSEAPAIKSESSHSISENKSIDFSNPSIGKSNSNKKSKYGNSILPASGINQESKTVVQPESRHQLISSASDVTVSKSDGFARAFSMNQPGENLFTEPIPLLASLHTILLPENKSIDDFTRISFSEKKKSLSRLQAGLFYGAGKSYRFVKQTGD